MRVREELNLDVPRTLEVALEEERPVAEGGRRLALGRGERLVELRRARTTRIPRPPPPAAAFTTSGRPISAGRPLGKRRNAGLPGDPLRRDLVAAETKRLGGGPTQMSPAASTASAKSAFSARKP